MCWPVARMPKAFPVVHCESGFSRSCAVALALHEHNGFATDLATLKEANPSILELMRAVRRQGTSHKPR